MSPKCGEVGRIENVPHTTYRMACPMCGTAVVLFWNGGELDMSNCCGLTYTLECERVDVVIYGELSTLDPVSPEVGAQEEVVSRDATVPQVVTP